MHYCFGFPKATTAHSLLPFSATMRRTEPVCLTNRQASRNGTKTKSFTNSFSSLSVTCLPTAMLIV
jgi:hypothetical protein